MKLTRKQILARFLADNPTITAADAPPPAPAANGDGTTPPPGPDPAAVAADQNVTNAIAAIDSDIDAAIAAQGQDPDTTDPKDAKVLAGLQQLKSIVQGVITDQAADTDDPPPASDTSADDDSSGDAPAPVTAAADDGSTPGNADGVPGDADDSPPTPGDIENDLTCQNPNCGHLSQGHNDTSDGDNNGSCTMEGCECPGMVPPDTAIPTGDDADSTAGDEGDSPPASGPQAPAAAAQDGTVAFADTPPPAAEAAPAGDSPAAPPPAASDAAAAPSGDAGDALPVSSPLPNEISGPAFTIPVGIIEGMETGDGRAVAEGALDWLNPPLPLMGLFTETHDPMGFDPNAPADVIGVIEAVMRRTDDNGVVMATGHLFTTDEGLNAAQIIEQMGRVPISADVGGRAGRPLEVEDVLDGMMPELPPGLIVLDDGTMDMPQVLTTLTQGTILGFTVCMHSAFEDCFIVLGDGSDLPPIGELVNRTAVPAPAPGLASDDEGSDDDTAAPAPAAPVLASMEYTLYELDECEPCATGAPTILASAARPSGGPIAPPKAWFDDPHFTIGDERLRETVDNRTGRLQGKFACPTTITAAGEVLGHLAQWGVCHTGPQYRGKCMMAPRNTSGYAYWYSGGQVLTAEGELVEVGPLTAGTGHAKPNLDIFSAIQHYDNTGTQTALVAVGEDDFGIWFHGALHPSATPEQVYTLRASVISGDWRPQGQRHELIAGLAVNRGGFPQPRAYRQSGRMTSLVAAAVPNFDAPVAHEPTLEERVAGLEGSFRPLIPIAVRGLRDRMAAVRGS